MASNICKLSLGKFIKGPRIFKANFRTFSLSKAICSSANIFSSNEKYSSTKKLNRLYATNPHYSDISRGPYSKIENSDIEFFIEILEKSRVISGSEDNLDGYNVDWLNSVKGNSQVVLKPKTSEEVSQIMRHCNARNLAVVPQAGNTSLGGGCIAVFDEIVVSTSLMNQIIKLDEITGVLVCESGCILHTLDEYLKDHGFVMPLDLGAKESCQIGGNLSTNAGGLRVLRYGSLHSTVLGIEAVLADGTILDCLSTMKKDNTGYDLKHLFIGSEGTLGILTKVAIQCPIKPNSTNLAFLGLESYAKVLETYKKAKVDLGEILSACEYIDDESIKCCKENLKLKPPIDLYPYYMMIETAGSNSTHDEEKLNTFLEDAMGKKLVTDGTVASEPSHMKSIWNVRERLADAMLKDGHLLIFDFSIPLETFEQLVHDTKQFLGNSVKRVTGFGHLGDGNIHLNVTMEKFNPEVLAKVEPFVYKWVADRKGSISAEHGLGLKKRHLMQHSKSKESIKMMKQVKNLFDPQNILNPYKVLPDNYY